MIALSRRIEIFVFPGSGSTTAPRLAREKSMSRCLSATTLLIGFPLPSVGLPGRDQPDGVRLSVRVNDHKQVRKVTQAQRHKSRIDDCGRILTSEGTVILEN